LSHNIAGISLSIINLPWEFDNEWPFNIRLSHDIAGISLSISNLPWEFDNNTSADLYLGMARIPL